VEEKTNMLIKDLISPNDIVPATRLILVNAIYFKGTRRKPFKKTATEEEDFHVEWDKTVKVQMMCMREEYFVYGHNDQLGCQAIELPYIGDELSMFMVLPDKTNSLSELEKMLTTDALGDAKSLFSMRRRDVNVWLPRFKFAKVLNCHQPWQRWE